MLDNHADTILLNNKIVQKMCQGDDTFFYLNKWGIGILILLSFMMKIYKNKFNNLLFKFLNFLIVTFK